MDAETLRSLRDFQIAHLSRWLESEEAEARWLGQARAAIDRAYDTKLEQLVDREALRRGLAWALTDELARGVGAPLAAFATEEGLRQAQGESLTLGAIVGPDARSALEELAKHPEIVDASMVREVTCEPAMEAVMRDVLFEALQAFNERTNPFVAPWGVPALLDALPRVGRSAIFKTIDKVRTEFERRLEPEMRRFLESFARKSLDRMVEIFADKAAEPELEALRCHALGVVLDRPLGELAWPADDPRASHLATVAREAAAHAPGALRERVEAVVEELWVRYAGKTLGALADELGVTRPDPEPLLAALWPSVRHVAGSDEVLAEIARFIDETHEAWLASR